MAVNHNLPTGCFVCGEKPPGGIKCSHCNVVTYCSNSHRSSDWTNHETACHSISSALETLEEKRVELIDKTPQNPFEHSAGEFWHIIGTREYMRARYQAAKALSMIDTLDAVTAVRDHYVDIMRLNSHDNMVVREKLAHVFLRLGQDQRCFNFMRRWNKDIRKGKYGTNGVDVPDPEADPFEDPRAGQLFIADFASLNFLVALTLIKLRMLKDLEYVQICREALAGSKLPEELVNEVQGYGLISTIIHDGRRKYFSRDNTMLIATLREQVELLFKFIDDNNKHLWLALSKNDVEANPKALPDYGGWGSLHEMQIVLQASCKAWTETPGAIEAVKGWLENKRA